MPKSTYDERIKDADNKEDLLELIKIINDSLPKSEKKSNKELFNQSVLEWKNIKKLITDKKNNNKDLIQDYINKWNDIKIIPNELIGILQK
jgi:hypothetical protein